MKTRPNISITLVLLPWLEYVLVRMADKQPWHAETSNDKESVLARIGRSMLANLIAFPQIPRRSLFRSRQLASVCSMFYQLVGC